MPKTGRKTERRIGVLMGGTSAEREVSFATGRPIRDALLERGYDAIPLTVDKEGLPAQLLAAGVEVVFNALHGGTGENGAVQGLLEMMNIPYTGSGILASALAMDKVLSKTVFASAGIPVPAYRVIRTPEAAIAAGSDPDFPAPWVLKPAEEGSSIGVSLVPDSTELADAAARALSYGPRALMETYVEGREVQIGVLADRAIGGVEVQPCHSFYDYECKYTSGKTEYVLPPELEPGLLERLDRSALAAHRALGCRAYSRVDFRVRPDGAFFILEVNTLPGMTPTSLLPKIARHAGISFTELLEEILGTSLES